MNLFFAVLLGLTGASLAALGGFIVGQWWRQRLGRYLEVQAEERVSQVLDRILSQIAIEDDLARAVDPVAHGGRLALSRVLDCLRDHGGYEAVVLSDDAGLTVAGCGSDELIETMSIEAATLGAASVRIHGHRQAILTTGLESRWTLHRFFQVDEALLSLSATRRGGTPRVEALDGALGAFQRVLGADEEAAA